MSSTDHPHDNSPSASDDTGDDAVRDGGDDTGDDGVRDGGDDTGDDDVRVPDSRARAATEPVVADVPDAAPPPAMPDAAPGDYGHGTGHGYGGYGGPDPDDLIGAPGDTLDALDALDSDEFMLGGEAAVPPGDYGPPIESVLPDRSSLSSEFRELQRRVMAQLSPAFPIEQRRRLPLAFLWKNYRKLAMRDRSDVVDEYGRDPVFLSRLEPMLEFLYRRYFRVDAAGFEHVPGAGRALLVANHSGTLPYDGAILMHAVRVDHPARRDVRPLVEDFVFHFPYLGTFINRMGGVRACQENAERLLRADRLVAVFPEGVKGIGKLFRQRYKLQRFGRGGFVKLALRTRAPIVPVAIVGAEEIFPMMSRVSWLSRPLGIPYIPVTPTFPWLGPAGLVPLPSKWYLRFGPMIDVAAQYGPEAADDQILVNRLAEGVRGTIQGMVDELLAARRSVLFG